MRKLVWVLGCLAACGGGSGGASKITIDRYDDALPAQLAIRDGDAAWKVLALDATDFTVESDRYLIAAACEYTFDGTTFAFSSMIGRTVDEGDAVELPCSSYDDAGQPRHEVMVPMQEPGSVRIGDFEVSQTTGPWTATLSARAGTHVLTAYDENRLAIRRDVAVSGPTTLDPISLATDGKPLVRKQFTLVGATDALASFSLLYADAELVWYAITSDLSVPIADPSQLTADDQRTIYLGAGERSVILTRYQESAPTSYELLPALTGVTRTGRTVAWTSVPDADEYLAQINSSDGMTTESIEVSAAWQGSATELSLDFTGIPNWNPAWVVDAGELSFEVQAQPDPNTTIRSSISLAP